MKKGFTLIELLIVVAIIAILAAIAVPNFLEAQVRAKVSRVKNDHRTLATALETYYVDNNTYPLFSCASAPAGATPNVLKNRSGASAALPTGTVVTAVGQVGLYNQPPGNGVGFLHPPKFATSPTNGTAAQPTPVFFTLTTPISYISSTLTDPFSNGGRDAFVYVANGPAWWLLSWGPNANQVANQTAAQMGEAIGQATDLFCANNTVFDVSVLQTVNAESAFSRNTSVSRPALTTGTFGTSGAAYTYDPTNGTTSAGDVWRIKD